MFLVSEVPLYLLRGDEQELHVVDAVLRDLNNMWGFGFRVKDLAFRVKG